MAQFVKPGMHSRGGLVLEDPVRKAAGPAHPYPAAQRERERAVLDLTDAAQAATQAAILLDRGEAAESHRLALLAQHLYGQADAHRLHADQAPQQRP